jgi:DNA-binding response OmpR family regulator
VADADPGVGAFVAEAFGGVGAEVLTVADGAAALDVAAREPVDVILLDLALPSPDARVVLRRLRRRRGVNMMTPVLALGSEPAQLGADSAATTGFDTLMAKPLTRIQLVSAVIASLHAPGAGDPRSGE